MQILPGVSASPVRPVSQVEHTSPDWVRAPSPKSHLAPPPPAPPSVQLPTAASLRRYQRRPLFNTLDPGRLDIVIGALDPGRIDIVIGVLDPERLNIVISA